VLDPPTLPLSGHLVVTGHLETRHVPIRAVMVPGNHRPMDTARTIALSRILRDDPTAAAPPVLLTPAYTDLYWLLQGRHRYAATLMAGRDELLAVIAEQADIR
jgi:hypothetical protein